MNISNAQIAFWTSLLGWAWTVKPIWSPFIDMTKTKRWWVLAMQLLLGISIAGVALSLTTGHFFVASLICFSLAAFASATHDIAADGYYMLALSQGDQAQYAGLRSTFYRAGMIAVQGGILALAGHLGTQSGDKAYGWMIAVFLLAAVLLVIFLYHQWSMAKVPQDQPTKSEDGQVWTDFFRIFAEFFKKQGIGVAILFMLFYRFPESQLMKMVIPFLKTPLEKGGLGLSTEAVGLAYGTIGILALLVGGILGGVLIARDGLRKWIWPMVVAIHIPNLVFLFLSFVQPQNIWVISGSIALEQLGYGIGFTMFMIYMMIVAEGENKTAHYAICTGFMAGGMMIPGMWSGWLQEYLGWHSFFVWIMICAIPSFFVTWLIWKQGIDPHYGKKEKAS
jgi:PAT family beta-lactamase induction signal transducer AmpG